MNCAEFQRVLPDIVEGGRSVEQDAHLRSCSMCSDLVSDLNLIAREARTLQASEEPGPRVWSSIETTLREWEADLNLISQQARTLQASEEPSPRVWNSIEIALRQEGLIRQPQRERSLVSWLGQRRALAWLPVAAAFLVAFSLVVFQSGSRQEERSSAVAPADERAALVQPMALDDQQVLEAVSSRSPAVRAAYETDLKSVNAYIRDAEQSAQTNPNDEEAQQYLMAAYEQKAMVYEMALNRSLP